MSAPASPRKDVFISHSSDDHAKAFELCEFLESRGLHCWIAPRDIPPGGVYSTEIVKAIHDTPCLLVVISSASNASTMVHAEVERAASLKRVIFSVFLERVKPAPAIELFVSTRQGTDLLLGPDNGPRLEALCTTIRNAAAADHSGGHPSMPDAVAPAPSRSGRKIAAMAAALALAIGAFLALRHGPPGPVPDGDHGNSATGTVTSLSVQQTLLKALSLQRDNKPDEARKVLAGVDAAAAGRLTAAVADHLDEARRADRQRRVHGLIDQISALASNRVQTAASSARPRILACIGPEGRGAAANSDLVLLFRLGLRPALERTGRAQVVERDALESVLSELKIGTSSLADTRAQTAIGHLLPAGLLLLGDAVERGGKLQVFVRLVDTETGQVIASLESVVPADASIDAATEDLARRVTSEMVARRPLQAGLNVAPDGSASLAIGTFHGVTAKTNFELLPAQGGNTNRIGTARVASLTAESAALTPDWKSAPAPGVQAMARELPE